MFVAFLFSIFTPKKKKKTERAANDFAKGERNNRDKHEKSLIHRDRYIGIWHPLSWLKESFLGSKARLACLSTGNWVSLMWR